jgi:hypothetical protein
MSALSTYVDDLEQELASGRATEHSYRPALKSLVEGLLSNLRAINEPTRVACGAPDFVVARAANHGPVTVGYMEAKDIGASLDAAERTDQLERYFGSLDNVILTDYLEFRWYVDGKPRATARLGNRAANRIEPAPDGELAVEALLRDFAAHSPGAIGQPEELARRLARLAHIVRDTIVAAFEQDAASDTLRDLRTVFGEVLIPNLTVEQYADMFAQTLAYGLFAARINHDSSTPFTRSASAEDIPAANPFLRRFFTVITGPDLADEPFASFVDDIAQLLSDADMDRVLANFGHATRRRDPIFHFYETFLAAYDPDVRDRLGVWYTPQSVVGYIVRSVDDVLRQEFDCDSGLADRSRVKYTRLDETGEEQEAECSRVVILDPAVGTGTFLYAVVDLIRERFREQGNAGLWPAYVREHLIPRLFGFECLMAPYAVAHLKLELQLAAADLPEAERADWAYGFGRHERLGVYLTNTLEQAPPQVTLPIGRFISDEANAATEVKRDLPVMVVLGNPPYQGQSSNPSSVEVKDPQTGRTRKVKTFIGDLHEDYYRVDDASLGERNPKWVGDDYAKFIRFGQWRIERSGAGVLAFITNHNYLDAPTFRGMRQQLIGAFTDIYVLDLHGRSAVPLSPDGQRDQNVFDIERGVSIGIFVKRPDRQGPARVWHGERWGQRADKEQWLDAHSLESTEWTELTPVSPYYRFVPVDADREQEYLKGWKLTDAMPVFSAGLVTGRDKVAVAFSKDELWTVLQDFVALPIPALRAKYPLPAADREGGDWSPEKAKTALEAHPPSRDDVSPLLYRPFDPRFTYLGGQSGGFVTRPREEVMQHMRHDESLGLISARSNNSSVMDHFFVSEHPTEAKAGESTVQSHLFPLYLFPSGNSAPEDDGRLELDIAENPVQQVNFAPGFTLEVSGRLGIAYDQDSAPTDRSTVGARDIFNYAYAILSAPSYRDRYAEFLRKDFPYLPLTTDSGLFFDLADLGAELIDVHLLRKDALGEPDVRFPVPGADVVEERHPRFTPPGEEPPEGGDALAVGRVYLSEYNQARSKRGQYFDGVSREVWEWEVGGRQPARDWLHARRGRILSSADLEHYESLLTAIDRTLELVEKIDSRLPGWPLP